jgi:tetratricopeptide (TPR) repeat protein
MVGRRRELTLLIEAFERTRESSRTHLVTVLGERGIGKRRLVEEFLSSLPTEADVMVGEASEFEEDATLAAVADLLRREVGIERDTPDEDVRKALEGAVASAVEPDEVDQVAGRLGLVLGLGDQEREGRRYRAAEIRAGFTSFVAGKARARPVVLVFQELQHAQPGVFDLIEHVLGHARRIPLMVVCSARDDLLEERPGWGGGLADAVTIRLEPLSPREAEDLARAAAEGLDDETAAAVARHTGGNPFFIVETTAMLLQAHDDAHSIGVAHSHVLPPTVQAVVASRVDHLSEGARDLVRKASVFPDGRFTVEDLSIIADPTNETLETLVDEEILVRDPKRTDMWRFRHGVLQDVVYDSVPKRERERLHLRAADVIEDRSEGRRPRAVAYHLERAALAALDLDPNDRRLSDRAVEALVAAGHEARRRIQSRTAIDLYERALDLAGPEERWGVREARILAGIGEARYWLGEYETAAGALRRALDLGNGDPWTDSLAGRFLADILLNVEGRPDLSTELFERALGAARELDDQWPIARTLLMAGWAPYWQGDLEGARTMFEEALVTSRANPDPDPWAEARALTSLASVISPQGDEADCLALGRQALDLGRSMKDPFTVAVALGYVGNSLRRMWQLADALPCLEEAVATFRDLDARWELASALGDRGHIRRLSGQYAEAEADLREALKLCRQLNERSLISWTAAELSWILVAQGNQEGARRIIDDAVDRASMDLPDVGTSLLVAQAVLALSNDDREAGLRLTRRSLDNERSVGWRNPVAAQTWLLGDLFGADEVGGEDALEDARATLEAAHWLHAVNEPDLIEDVIRGTPVHLDSGGSAAP